MYNDIENSAMKPPMRRPAVIPPEIEPERQMTRATMTMPSEMAAGSCHTHFAPSQMLCASWDASTSANDLSAEDVEPRSKACSATRADKRDLMLAPI